MAILVAVEIVARLLAGALSRLLAHIPVVGSLNRLGGVVLGALLAVVLVWLLTASLLLVPHSLLSFSGTVSRSKTTHLLRTLTPRWGQDLRAYANHFTAGHLAQSDARAPAADRWAGSHDSPAVVVVSAQRCPEAPCAFSVAAHDGQSGASREQAAGRSPILAATAAQCTVSRLLATRLCLLPAASVAET